MSKTINLNRRFVIKSSMVFATSILLSRKLFSDEISDIASFVNDDINEIVAVRIWPSSTYTRITIESTNNVKTDIEQSDKFLTLTVFDVEVNNVLNNMHQKVIDEDPIIDHISVQNSVNNQVLIKIRLKSPVGYQTNSLSPVNLVGVSYQYRYILDLYPRRDANNNDLNDDILALIQLNDIDATEKSSSQISQPVLNKDPLPVIMNKRVTSNFNKNLTIMIDPGHGGEDPGAIGPTGLKEKDVVLDIGHKLKALLDKSNNFRAYMTRSQDVFVPLGTRVKMARKTKADIFISIHADAFTNDKATGASVFVLSEKGSSSAFARWLAKTQNDSDLIGGLSFKLKDRTVNSLLMDMTHTYTKQNSVKLGSILLKNMSTLGKLHKSSIEKANFAVLKAPDITSVLLETAFISNRHEEKLLKSSDHRDKIAWAILHSLERMLG